MITMELGMGRNHEDLRGGKLGSSSTGPSWVYSYFIGSSDWDWMQGSVGSLALRKCGKQAEKLPD